MTDEELVYLIREKNEDAEYLFMKRYESIIPKISFAAVGHFANDSEVISTAYIVLMQCVYSYDDILNNNFKAYFSMCLRRRLNSLLKKYRYSEKSRWNYNYLDLADVEISDYTLNDPVQKYIFEEEKGTIVQALTPLEKRIFIAYVEGYQALEIALDESVPIKKVYNTIHKVRKMLKR